MLISPAEPERIRTALVAAGGTVNRITEDYGSDFLIHSPVYGIVGVQRKTIDDLIASVRDGRVERELWEMKKLDWGVWIIEGVASWTLSGALVGSRSKWTKAQHQGVLFSISMHGYAVFSSTRTEETLELLTNMEKWLKKERHSHLLTRPKMGNGIAGDKKDQQIHIMQGFPGVGYGKAKLIVEHCGGLPMKLSSGVNILEIEGIGPKLIASITSLLSSEE